MLSVKSKIKSLSENERLFFDHLANDQVIEVSKEFEDKLVELELAEKDDEGDLCISFDVHINWSQICADELEGID